MDAISQKLTQQILKNGADFSQEGQLKKSSKPDGADSDFAKVLDGQGDASSVSNQDLLASLDQVSSAPSSSEQAGMNVTSAEGVEVTLGEGGEIPGNGLDATHQNIFDMVADSGKQEMQLDRAVQEMVSGKGKFSLQKMTAIQLKGHQFVVELEIMSKVGESVNKIISQPFQMQV